MPKAGREGGDGAGDNPTPSVPATPVKPPIWKMDLGEADHDPRPQMRDNSGER